MRLINRVLNGVAQIMLQENRLTGLLFLAGLFVGHWVYGISALIATLTGTLTAQFLKYDEKETDSGLYGFSPALVGVLMVFLFDAGWLCWLLIIIGSVFAAMIQHFFILKKIPAYTFPFIVVSWLFVFFVRRLDLIQPAEITTGDFLNFSANQILIGTKSYGQVIFQGNTFSGILFFVGVLISSRTMAVFALVAAFLTSFLALIAGYSADTVYMGLMGYNSVLTAIVFAGFKPKDGFWVFLSVILTLAVQIIFIESGWLNAFGGVLTFPFVAATWLTLITQKLSKSKESKQSIS